MTAICHSAIHYDASPVSPFCGSNMLNYSQKPLFISYPCEYYKSTLISRGSRFKLGKLETFVFGYVAARSIADDLALINRNICCNDEASKYSLTSYVNLYPAL